MSLRILRWQLVALALAALLLPAAAGAQQVPPLLAAEISLSGWGIDDPAAIRLGRLSVARAAAGQRLDVLHLRTGGPDAEELPTDFETAARKPEVSGSCLVVADFAAGNRNRLGGDFNVFQRRPSSSDFDLDRRPHGRRSLLLSYHRAGSGFAGWWTHLYDSRRPALRTYLDAGDFTHLSLWVRGRQGGERLLLKLADERFDRLGDSLAVGELGSYVPAGRLSTEWQRAAVRLADAPPALDRSRLASLVLEAVAGTGAVELGPIAFCRGADEHPALPPPVPRPPAAAVRSAIWVWNTGEILADDRLRARFLADLDRGGFDQVYLQLPSDTGVPARLAPEAGLRSLVAAIAGLGLSVRALDGHATFVETENRPRVLATIADVAAYNAAVPVGERFDGVHYDVEPYLLPGFGGPRRDEILRRYVELVAAMAVLARRHGLLLGVDLPFWYDAPDEWSGEMLTVGFAGRRRPVVEHVIDLADYVTLMDYRTRAYGPDGVLAHAAGELAYAARVGKKVYLGLETGELADEQYLDFDGPARPGLPPAGSEGEWTVVAHHGDAATVYLVPAGGLGELGRRLADRTGVLHWPVGGRVDVPAAKLTFADLGGAALAAVMRQVGHELSATPSFAGFALHHYGSLGRLRGFAPR